MIRPGFPRCAARRDSNRHMPGPQFTCDGTRHKSSTEGTLTAQRGSICASMPSVEQ